jgi:rhodanese-related sulfurtransferase
MSKILVTLLLLCLAACGRNRFEQEVETEDRSVSLVREMQRGGYEVIGTDDLKALLDKKTPMVLVDTMPFEDSYKKSHIPGAKHFEFPIPELVEWDAAKTGGKSQAQFAELLGADKEALLVFYCGFVQCTRSHNAAMWAKKLGFRNVKRHPGGIFAWKGKGYPTATAP